MSNLNLNPEQERALDAAVEEAQADVAWARTDWTAASELERWARRRAVQAVLEDRVEQLGAGIADALGAAAQQFVSELRGASAPSTNGVGSREDLLRRAVDGAAARGRRQ